MDVTIAVVTYNAAEYLKNCLDSILRQESHNGRTEILVVDGCSSDRTQEIAHSFGSRVRLIENPKRTIAANRNVALREASFAFIAFTDADCVVPQNWLFLLVSAFNRLAQKNSCLAAVGGGNQPPESLSPVSIALDSFLGSLGSVQGMASGKERPVFSLANLNVLYSKAALESVGGYDGSLANLCEDTDLNYRLIKSGWKLYFIPGVIVTHYAKVDFVSWCRKMYLYGVGRAIIIYKHRSFFNSGYLLASFFLPVLLISGLIGLFWPWALLVWLYFPFIICAGFVLAFKKSSLAGLSVGIVLLGTHIFYALGLWRGVCVIILQHEIAKG